jgi:uncharacterized protein YcnI
MRYPISIVLLTLVLEPAHAQVAVNPVVTTPAAWERFSVRVINQTDTPTVTVRVEVPAVVMVLGVEPKTGWTFQVVPSVDSGPSAITWTGGAIRHGEYGEFPFLGRLQPQARQEDLVFPVRIQRENGSVVEWRHQEGEPYAAPRVEIAGTVHISPAGQFMMAGAAMGIAILALVVAVAKGVPRRS